jgi:hypothetical protein
MMQRGMETDFSWDRSAGAYLSLYEELTASAPETSADLGIPSPALAEAPAKKRGGRKPKSATAEVPETAAPSAPETDASKKAAEKPARKPRTPKPKPDPTL